MAEARPLAPAAPERWVMLLLGLLALCAVIIGVEMYAEKDEPR